MASFHASRSRFLRVREVRRVITKLFTDPNCQCHLTVDTSQPVPPAPRARHVGSGNGARAFCSVLFLNSGRTRRARLCLVTLTATDCSQSPNARRPRTEIGSPPHPPPRPSPTPPSPKPQSHPATPPSSPTQTWAHPDLDPPRPRPTQTWTHPDLDPPRPGPTQA